MTIPRIQDQAPDGPLGRRRLLHMARTATANARWRRYQEAAGRRGWDRERGGAERRMDLLLAHSRWLGRVTLLLRCGLWDLHIKDSLGGRAAHTVGVISYAQSGPDPDAHPRAIFDQPWYLERNPDVVAKGWCPLAHYLTVGDALGCDPHPLFDLADYRARHAVKIAACGLTALQHFVYSGAREGFAPHPLFDVRYYVGQCEAVAKSGENPLAHYLRQGWREGLDPHPLFAGDWYLTHTPDARASGIAPLLHYVLAGMAEGRSPHPLFNAAWYTERHGDGGLRSLVESAETPRDPGPNFDSAFYMAQRPELPADLHPLVHYLTEGGFEGVAPAADFDEAAYLAANPKAVESPLTALEHWARSREA